MIIVRSDRTVFDAPDKESIIVTLIAYKRSGTDLSQYYVVENNIIHPADRWIQSAINSATSEEDFSALLHKLFCHKDHEENCGWNYETNWSDPTHATYLAAAKKIYALGYKVTAVELFNIMLIAAEFA